MSSIFLYSGPCPLYPASVMPPSVLQERAVGFVKQRPDIRPGFTVRVHERILEGDKERVQIFEGLVIAFHKGATPADASFTVRRIASGVGVERVFPFHSPVIDRIDVKKVAKVRRAKLFFLRGQHGKAARLSERFTTAEEFAVVAAGKQEVPAATETDITEAVTAEEAKEKAQEAEDAAK